MKQFIINSTMNNIKMHKDFDDIKLAEIKYGLESIYLTITKTIVITLLSILFGTIKELMGIFLFYGLLRLTGFGAHTKTTIQCWIFSLIVFLTIPHLVKTVIIPNNISIIISIILLGLIILYAPADTEKRPLINKKKRIRFKILCSINTIIYILLIIIINNNYLTNILLFSILIQVIMVLPITYKLLGIKYNNYKNYKKGGL